MNEVTVEVLPSEVVRRGISAGVWSAVKNSIFPGASDDSVLMAVDYCAARQLDVLLKPVHLVPMYIKDKNNNDQGSMRDVVMPGIGLYRIQADRAGNYAGMSAPTFGPDIDDNLGGVKITYPEWCEITVSKLIGERIVSFTAREYWKENYATSRRDSQSPNAMWAKRPRGQLVKCTEAQALRRGWPELGAQPTAEEMEGKEIDITPHAETHNERCIDLAPYPEQDFLNNFPKWRKAIDSGMKTADDLIAMIETKGILSEEQKAQIKEPLEA